MAERNLPAVTIAKVMEKYLLDVDSTLLIAIRRLCDTGEQHDESQNGCENNISLSVHPFYVLLDTLKSGKSIHAHRHNVVVYIDETTFDFENLLMFIGLTILDSTFGQYGDNRGVVLQHGE